MQYFFFSENLCCSYPCQNGGVCLTKGFKDYECDCTSTDFYGRNCETRKYLLAKKLFSCDDSVKYDISCILDVCSNEKKGGGGVTQPTSLGICVLYLTSRRGIFF